MMKMNYPYAQANKGGQNLLKQILDENTTLNGVDMTSVNEILQVFKIPQSNMDRNSKIAKIKQKLLDVIVDEKDECVNYLILPKFNSISEASKTVLKQIITSTWNLYLSKQVEQQKNKKYSKYFCRSNNLKQTEEFHLGLFNFFRSMYFYQNHSYYRMIGNYAPMMAPMPSTPQQYQNYNGMTTSMPGTFYPVAISQQTNGNQQNNIKVEDKGEGSQIYNIKEEVDKKTRKKHGSVEESKNKPQKQSSSHQVNFKIFSGCVCKGKISQTERYFQCQQCQKKYHLNCLGIPNSAIERPGIKKRCPQCYLKNTNSFYDVVGQLQTFWTDDRELNKQKITIKAKKCKEIQEKKYSVQLRFMKIEGKTMYDWQVPGQVKLENQQKIPGKQVLNQIFINSDVFNKGAGQDVKIGLDCMKSSDPRPEDKKPALLFVAVNIVHEKSQQQMLSADYDYFEDDFLDKILRVRQEPLKIQINNIDFKMIKKPARGADCQHPDVYDVQEYVNHLIDLRTDQCFVCSRKCRTLKIDRKIESQLKKIRQTFDDQTKYPSAIFYYKDGTFKWGQCEQKKQQQMISERENIGLSRINYLSKIQKNKEESQMQEQFSSINAEDNDQIQSEEDEEMSESKSSHNNTKNKKKKPSKTIKIKKNKN